MKKKSEDLLLNNESMYSLLQNKISKYDNRVAVTYGSNKLKYNSFLKKINEYSFSFEKLGITKDDVVTFVTPVTIDAIICIYSLNKIGAICNIMHHLSSLEEIKNSVIETKSKCLITYEYKINEISNIKEETNIKNIIYINNSDILSTFDKIKHIFDSSKLLSSDYIPFYKFKLLGRHLNIKNNNINNEISLIINSNSKKVILTNDNLNYYASEYSKMNKILLNENSVFADEAIVNIIPIIHRTFINGQNMIIDPKNNSKSIINTIYKHRPNILEISPSTLEQIISNKSIKNDDLSYIKLIICGKSILSEYVYDKALKVLDECNSDASIVTSYGSQELTSNITMSLENDITSLGKPISNTKIKIVNINTLKEVQNGEIGQICISGPAVMKEYLNSNKNALKKDKNNNIWLYSDDLGYLDNNNNLHFKSNIKRIIISNGIEIYPEELENIIKKHKYIKDVSIVGVPHPYKKEVVKAYLVLKDGLVLNSEIKKSVKEYCEKNISKYALPYAYAYRNELPKTNYGKVAYTSLVNLKSEED